MALNVEQLTAMMNEVTTQQEIARQESVRRAQEHVAMHSAMEQITSRLDFLEAKVDQAARGNTRGPGGIGSIGYEASKRLDRWATGTSDKPFQGTSGSTSLREWVQAMKDGAGYCVEELQRAMEETERLEDEIAISDLSKYKIDEPTDQA